jgi:hypothetical protein
MMASLVDAQHAERDKQKVEAPTAWATLSKSPFKGKSANSPVVELSRFAGIGSLLDDA